MNFPFKIKQISLVAALFLIIGIATIVIAYSLTIRNFVNNTQNQFTKLNKSFDGISDEQYAFHFANLQQLAANESFLHSLSTNNIPEIEKFISTQDNTYRFFVISPSYEILVDSNNQKLHGTFPYPGWLTTSNHSSFKTSTMILNGNVYQSSLISTKTANNTYWLVVARPLISVLPKTLSVLSLAPFNMQIAYKDTSKAWQFQNSNATFIDQTNQKKLLTFLDKLKDPLDYAYKKTKAGMTFVLPLMTPDKNIKIVALVNYTIADILTANKALFYEIGALILSALLILFALIWGSLQSMIKTIKHIIAAILATEKGEYEEPIPVQGAKETQELAQVVNNMIKDSGMREKELVYQGRHDPVTKLPNRYYFLEYLSQRLSKCDPATTQMAIAAIAVDRFTQINHTLGHPVGQRLLHHVGARLANNIHHAEMLGQLTNHVFVALLPNVNPTNYASEAQIILSAFETAFSVYTVNIDLDGLVGFSFYPQDGVDADILIQKSDVALYSAKYTSERCAIYNTDKDPHHFTKLSLMSELREGITQNEFEVYYQPKIDLASGRIVQVESLIRWVHPIKGFMSPGLFIPLAEETGHIKKLTLWLIDKTLEQCAKWHKDGFNLGVSINLSVKDLLNKELYQYITTCMKAYEVDPTWITLEITESAFMHDPDKAMEAIHKLRDFGFHFSIDDFGTGFSSLSYLKQLPVNELKIDQSFIRDIVKQSRVADLVRSTVEMGHTLKMAVVAEGIEDAQTHQLLKSFGCDIGQGYLYSKPLKVSDLNEWMKTSEWGV